MMNVILLVKNMHRPVKIHLTRPRAVLLMTLFLLPMMMAGYAGFYWGSQSAREAAVVDIGVVATDADQTTVSRELHEHVNALAARLGTLQAHVIRLDAVGRRLVDLAGLDNGEFNFNNPPSQGGPESVSVFEQPTIKLPGLLQSVDALDKQLEDRGQQFNVLESFFMNRNLLNAVLPAGRPVQDGWVSSFFGFRADPFTGRRAHHDGVDIAGKKGDPIEVVASGIVIFSGERSGYGNLVEINHGNGYVTRYGHNALNVVKEGDRVTKGQVVAMMGSTGRSTGPHVHFEVLRDGRIVNPIKYLSDVR